MGRGEEKECVNEMKEGRNGGGKEEGGAELPVSQTFPKSDLFTQIIVFFLYN